MHAVLVYRYIDEATTNKMPQMVAQNQIDVVLEFWPTGMRTHHTLALTALVHTPVPPVPVSEYGIHMATHGICAEG